MVNAYEVMHIQVTAGAGVHILEFIRQIIVLSLNEKRTVVGIHNDKNYVINPNDIVDLALRWNDHK